MTSKNLAMDELLSAYREILETHGHTARRQKGRMQVLGWDLEYACAQAVANFIDQILVRRLSDFIADNEQPRILDCGANIGFTVLHYKRMYPGSRITAFEPDPEFAPLLRRNIEHNDLSDVEVIEAAAWTRDGKARWFCEGIDGSHLVGKAGGPGDTVLVSTVDLARFLRDPVDLLKLDIEGAEYEVVTHLGEVLRNVKNILVECHVDQTTILPFGRLLAALQSAGFSVSLNSFGAWRDLVRQPSVEAAHWEQYLVVAGWRGTCAAASPEVSTLPYHGAELEDELRAIRRRHARSRQSLARLQEHGAEMEQENARLLQWLKAHFITRSHVVRRVVLAPPFAHDQGSCWVAGLRGHEAGADDLDFPKRSPLLLFEDGMPLGPAHSIHDEIRELGGGRFSHWRTDLYFSASDSSDPNRNGRRYIGIYLGEVASKPKAGLPQDQGRPGSRRPQR